MAYDYKGIVRAFVEFGANINIRSPHARYCSELTSAAQCSSVMVQYLLGEKEVDTNMLDIYGRTIVSRGFGSLDLSQF
jgi:hypothetical protein